MKVILVKNGKSRTLANPTINEIQKLTLTGWKIFEFIHY